MKNYILVLAFCVSAPVFLNAQLGGVAYVEYGYSVFKFKSDELLVFADSYNSFFNPAQPFGKKVGMAKGDYLKIGLGFGENLQMVVDYTQYKAESEPLSVRFADGSGRDVWYQVRNSNSNVGLRLGGTKDIRFWAQANINLMIQEVTVLSGYVFPDGSRSMGYDHSMNGSFSDNNLIFGLGFSAGCRILGPLAVSASMDYIGRGLDSKSHPEYHQYDDNNDVGTDSYVPRDVAAYNAGAYATENSISNDFRGWRFSFGVVLMFTNIGE